MPFLQSLSTQCMTWVYSIRHGGRAGIILFGRYVSTLDIHFQLPVLACSSRDYWSYSIRVEVSLRAGLNKKNLRVVEIESKSESTWLQHDFIFCKKKNSEKWQQGVGVKRKPSYLVTVTAPVTTLLPITYCSSDKSSYVYYCCCYAILDITKFCHIHIHLSSNFP